MAHDFTKVPEFLQIINKDLAPLPRTLSIMGEALELAYNLLEHPALLDRYDAQDPFIEAMKDPDYYKKFNRTIIERTIHEAKYYGRVEFKNGMMSVSSKGIEIVFAELKSILEDGNELYALRGKNKHDAEFGLSYRYFQITSGGKLTGAISGMLHTCQYLVLQVRKDMMERELAGINEPDEKKVFLLRAKANLLKQKDNCSVLIFEGLSEYFEIELDFLKSSTPGGETMPELKLIIERFFNEQKARINNDTLLASLVNSEFDKFKQELKELVIQVFSYHDISGKEPEKVYHSFLLGLFNRLNSHYEIKSNKEAGIGRFDIVLIPNLPYFKGIIFEVKKIETQDTESIREILQGALNQIDANKYYLELKSKGCHEYVGISAAFFGKNLYLDHVVSPIP